MGDLDRGRGKDGGRVGALKVDWVGGDGEIVRGEKRD